MATYNLRPRKQKKSQIGINWDKRKCHGKIRAAGKLLKQYRLPKISNVEARRKAKAKAKAKEKAKGEEKENKVKKQYEEPTHLKAIYWVAPVKRGQDYAIDVQWFGLPGFYPRSLTAILEGGVDGGGVEEVASECQLRHCEYRQFSRWFMAQSVQQPQLLRVNDIVYDTADKKYLEILRLPRAEQLYVWPGFGNYLVGFAREFDAYCRLIGGTDGWKSDTEYLVFKEEIEPIANLQFFYFKQNAKDVLCHILRTKLWSQFQRKMKAKKLRFYENLSGKVWSHYIEKELVDNGVNVDGNNYLKKWTLSLEKADELFSDGTISLFKRKIGIREYFVDDMDFVFNVKLNKLRIYSVIYVENTESHSLFGNDIDKR